jgi:hypothetical protein
VSQKRTINMTMSDVPKDDLGEEQHEAHGAVYPQVQGPGGRVVLVAADQGMPCGPASGAVRGGPAVGAADGSITRTG